MKKSIAAFCFMFAISPLALAQTKADEKKAAPAATAPAPVKAEEKKAAPATTAPAPAPAKAAAPKADDKKMASTGEKKGKGERKGEGKGKGEPTEAQKAQRAKMKSCAADASGKNLKGDERKKFMSNCLKG